MALLGLDPATRCGWAVMNRDGVKAGSWAPRPGSPPGRIFSDFERWLSLLMEQHNVTDAAMEEPLRSDITRTEKTFDSTGLFGPREKVFKRPITNMHTLRRLYGIAAVVQLVCHVRGVPLTEYNQTAWRSTFLGLAHAPRGTKDGSKWLKDRSVQTCRRLQIDVSDDNAADAVGVVSHFHSERKKERLVLGSRPNPLDQVFRR